MSKLRQVMDAAFWDLTLSSPQTLDACAKSVPGEPLPLRASPTSRALRPQQLALLGSGFPLGIVPSLSPTSPKELGSFALQSLLFQHEAANWWVGLVGQLRPKKLVSSIKAEVMEGDELEIPAFKDVVKHFLDKSLYSLGLCSQFSLSPASSLFFSTEVHGKKKGHRSKAMFFHQLPYHDVSLEAAWPELFLDSKGGYWDLPSSVSLDLSSHASESGLRYRIGLHKSSGQPQAFSATSADVPPALMPGLCANAAVCYEKSKDLWRQRETRKDVEIKTEKGRFRWLSYDRRLREPHAAISGIIGATCTSWLAGRGDSSVGSKLQLGDNDVRHEVSLDVNRRSLFGVDAFSSMCCTFQHGRFKKDFLDLTRLDARLDICSASAFLKSTTNLVSSLFKGPVKQGEDSLSSPRLNFIFHQQIAGPIVFRVDSRLALDSSSGRFIPQVEDTVYSLNYSLALLESGKVVAWYSPKRKEGMVEVRLYEF
ncbi:protein TRIGALACTOSYLDIACYLGLYCEROL 4, chloroplastic [Aristolochia californica]|uniref:protein TRIGALACTOSYLDIACYLGLYCEROL 4, chloroplastic n=1 Tax=Aristolochia californica TaxID=171875 RepID=UPI0035D6BD56